MTPSTTRRRLLSALVLGVGGIAGCSGRGTESGGDDIENTDADARNSGETAEATRTPSASEEPTAEAETAVPASESPASDTTSAEDDPTPAADDELDLREANVVDVAVEGSSPSRFDVTLFHDDDGESGYADWWQVETLSGEQLGRRTLFHAHSTAPFTRSERITIPDETTYVVVRGHDQTHGYGGQAMVVNVETRETEPVRQGPEPRDFSDFEPRV